mmetsp:Transcript_73220/g.138145  ORF Transcript_73220/g.138145 Transcript_73220/m.138145 type:complete len:430 (-) Transcript_73220:95-1384(-)
MSLPYNNNNARILQLFLLFQLLFHLADSEGRQIDHHENDRRHICLLQSHEPFTKEDVSISMSINTKSTGNRANAVNVLSTALNREYACLHGYTYIHASSPGLSVRTKIDLRNVCGDSGSFLSGEPGADPRVLPNARVAKTPALAVDRYQDCKVGVDDERRRRRGIFKRGSSWCKVSLIAEVFEHVPHCKVVGFLDSDLLLEEEGGMPPLHEQPQFSAWFGDRLSPALISAEPNEPRDDNFTARSYHPKNAQGRNDLQNTKTTTAFIFLKRAESARALLKKWWCSVDQLCDPKRGLKVGCYRLDWAREQKMFDVAVLPYYNVTTTHHYLDYNTPDGHFAKHFYFKGEIRAVEYLRARMYIRQRHLKHKGHLAHRCSIEGISSATMPTRGVKTALVRRPRQTPFSATKRTANEVLGKVSGKVNSPEAEVRD